VISHRRWRTKGVTSSRMSAWMVPGWAASYSAHEKMDPRWPLPETKSVFGVLSTYITRDEQRSACGSCIIDVNRSLWFWASIVCLRFLAESGRKRARVQSRSSEREPKGNLDGFLGRLHAFAQNEGQQVPGCRLGSECSGAMSQYRKDCIDQRSGVRASSNSDWTLVCLDLELRARLHLCGSLLPGTAGREVGRQ
jgi:hypothetical protein